MGSKKKTRKVPQGSLNPYSPWSCATFKWIKQLVFHHGLLDPLPHQDLLMLEPSSVTKHQWIASYQEQVRLEEKCLASMSSSILLECDSNGKISNHGAYEERKPVQVSVKYNKEICLLLGAMKVKYNDGQIA
eukprot:14372069-Ditylum_brightwellii.AAC.1